MALAASPAHARVWIVDVNAPNADKPGDRLYSQIHEAVAVAGPGDVIKVHAGTYEPFSVTIDRVTVREARASSNPVVDATTGAGSVSFTPAGGEERELFFAVHVAADRVSIRGLETRNATHVLGRAYGFLVTGARSRLIGNAATANANGFGVFGGDRNRLIRNRSIENGNGIEAAFASRTMILRNSCISNTKSGFIESGTTDSVVARNFAYSSGLAGFHGTDTRGSRFTRNLAENSGYYGYQQIGTTLSTFIANRALETADFDGFHLFGCVDATLARNRSSANSRAGLWIEATIGGTFIRNRFQGNGNVGVIVLRSLGGVASSGNVFRRTTSTGNFGYGVFVEQSPDNTYYRTRCASNADGGSNVAGICN